MFQAWRNAEDYEGCRGIAELFATIPFHFVLFPAAIVELAKSIPVHS